MSTETTSAAPLINLAIYCVTLITLAGIVYWLGRWLARTAGTSFPRAASGGTLTAPPPTWERTVRPRRGGAHQGTAEGWQPVSLFALLERFERLAVWGIFGVALFLRVAFLGRIPDNVTADELDFAGDALAILNGNGPPFFGLDWTPGPALSVHLISWSWRLFGVTIFAERLVSALFTAIAVFPFYALLRRVVTVPAALAASILLASSWWLLNFSRSGWNNGHIILYMLLAAWALTRALERQRWLDWVGFGAALALLLYGYFSGRTVVIAFLAYLPFVLWWRWRGTSPNGWRRPLAGALIAGVVCTLLFLPMVFVALKDLSKFTNRTSSVFILNHPREPGETVIDVLAQQTWTTIRSFVLMDTITGDGRYKGPGLAWLDPLSASLYLVGLLLAVRRGRAMVLWWCLLLIPLGLTQILSQGIPDGARGLAAVAPMYFFAALTIDAIITQRWLRGRVVQVAIVAVVIFIAVLNTRDYVTWMGSPHAHAVRQPSIPVAEFPRWRDFQIQRLRAGQGIMGADAYKTLSPAVITATIAGEQPEVIVNPQVLEAQHTATFGVAGNGTGQLNGPSSAAIDEQGNIYVADQTRGKIVRYAPDGTFLNEWGDPEQRGAPTDVIVAPDGTVVALAADVGLVNRYDREGAFLEQVAMLGGRARGITLGHDGRIYVAYTSSNQIVVLPGTSADPIPAIDPGTQIPPYDQPTSAIADSAGILFVYEPTASRLQSYAPDGKLLFSQPAPGSNTIAAGGLALLPDGRLLLADTAARQILVYRADGSLLGSFPVEGTPSGISVTPSGMIAVTDIDGRCVRLYALGNN
jgi:sugar lactone lactonase YvrE